MACCSVLFASGSGGCGRSTLCAHLGAALARRGRRVLVLEAVCGFRSLELLLRLPGETVYDLSDVLEDRCSLGEAILTHEASGLRLMAAPGDPAYLPKEDRLTALFRWAGEKWDFLLADCAAGFGPMTRLMARHCGLAALVAAPEELSARSAGRLSAFLAGEGVPAQRLIINRIPRDFAPTSGLRDLDDVIDLCGVQLLGAVPEEPDLPPPGEHPADGSAGLAIEATARRLLGERAELTIYP